MEISTAREIKRVIDKHRYTMVPHRTLNDFLSGLSKFNITYMVNLKKLAREELYQKHEEVFAVMLVRYKRLLELIRLGLGMHHDCENGKLAESLLTEDQHIVLMIRYITGFPAQGSPPWGGPAEGADDKAWRAIVGEYGPGIQHRCAQLIWYVFDHLPEEYIFKGLTEELILELIDRIPSIIDLMLSFVELKRAQLDPTYKPRRFP